MRRIIIYTNSYNKCLAVFVSIKKNSFYFWEIEEFKKLVDSSNFIIKYFLKFNLNKFNIKFFFTKGKLERIFNYLFINKLNYLLLNVDLKSSQQSNLEFYLKCLVLDKTQIILNIFRKRANNYYGKLQVDLAYFNYIRTRLVRKWSHLERQRGGIKNISGPGEKQIEIDKRIINKKIIYLKKKLNNIIFQRNKGNEERKEKNILNISLVGYTNSGKSTLFNFLTNSSVSVKDNYFTSLDACIRRSVIKNINSKILFTDTIGFVNNLPKTLLSAFKSTLSEINDSELILHVVDVSNVYFKDHISIVNNILKDVLSRNINILLVMNKIDKIFGMNPKIDKNLSVIWISSKYKLGLDILVSYINNYFLKDKREYIFVFDLSNYLFFRKIFLRKFFLFKEWSVDAKNFFIKLKLSENDLFILLRKYNNLKNFLDIKYV